MIGKIIVLILLIVAQAHAYTIDTTSSDTYVKDFGIYVYGDIESIENAFILVQAIATSNQLQTIIALFMTFFLPYVTYRHLMQGQFRAWTTNVVYATGSILFMSTSVVPSASIHIEDLRTSTIYAGLPARTYAKIDQIPYPIALVTSTISTLTDSLTLLYEDAVALIDPDLGGASATAVGTGKGLGDLLKVLQYSSFDGLNDANTSLFIRSLLAYTESCGIKGALNDDPDKLINFKNPSKDIFKSISPTALGITGSSYTLEFTDATNGTKSYQCDVFWNNNIISQYETVSDKLLEKVNKMTTSDLTSPDVITAHTKMGGEVADAVVATDLGKYKAFQLNIATVPLMEKAFKNHTISLSDAEDLTRRFSIADIQVNGAGQMKWISEILPYGYHFMLGIIYSISILVMIMATAMGVDKGFMIWKNFVKGLTTYELIKVSLVIVNATVNQYTAKGAIEVISAIGQNPGTVDSIPAYYDYLATMSGIAGTLGAIAIFSIPAMIFSGEVSMAMGALSSVANKYKGNPVSTAGEVSSEQRAKQDAYENEMAARAMVDHLGLDVPSGMAASDYYGMYKKGAEVSNANWGAQRMGTGAIAQAGVGIKGQTMQSISGGQTLASNVAMNDFVESGVSSGLKQAGGIKGEVAALNDFGGDDIQLSAKLGSYTQAAEGVSQTNARIRQGLATEGGTLTGKAMRSMETRFNAKAAEEAAIGDLSGEDSNRYISASGKSAMMKAHQMIGDTEGQMKQYNDEAKRAGKELAEVIKDVANTVAQAKTGSTIGGINQVGAGDYIQNQITKAQSDSESLDRTINRAGTPSNYINTNARQAAGQFGAMMDTMSEADKKYAGQGGYEGMLSINAMKQVDDGYATYKGETSGANPKRNMDGTLTSAGENALSFSAGQKAGEEIRRAENFNDQNTMNAIMTTMINRGKTAQERMDIAQDMYSKNAIQWARFDKEGNLTDVMASVGIDAAAAMGEMEGEKLTSKMGGAWANGKQFQVANGGKSAPTISSKKDTSDTEDDSETYNSGERRNTGHKMKAANTFARTVLGKDASQADVEAFASKIHDSSEIANFLTDKEGLTQASISSIKAAGDATGQGDKVDAFINGLSNEEGFTNGEALTGALTLTALTGYGAGRATKALTGKGLVARFRGESEPISKSQGQSDDYAPNNSSGNPKQDSKHSDSFQDNKKYTEEFGESKGKFKTEARNLESLEERRGLMNDNDPRAHKLDEQIAESRSRMAGHERDMEIADRNGKATRYLASKDIEAHAPKSKFGFLAKSAISIAAAVGIANAGEVGEVVDGVMGAAEALSSKALGIFSPTSLGEGNDNPMAGLMTIKAMQNDPGLPAAIDAHHTAQNIFVMQSVQPNTITTMQTRSGDMSFVRNSGTGNLDVHLPNQAFAENTNIPFAQFQALSNDPVQAQQFAQMIAKSAYEDQGSGGVASATDLDQLKTEINNNFQSSDMKVRNINSSTSLTAMEIENQTEMIEDNIASTLIDMTETLEEVKKSIERR